MYYVTVIYFHFEGQPTWFVVFYVYVGDYIPVHISSFHVGKEHVLTLCKDNFACLSPCYDKVIDVNVNETVLTDERM